MNYILNSLKETANCKKNTKGHRQLNLEQKKIYIHTAITTPYTRTFTVDDI